MKNFLTVMLTILVLISSVSANTYYVDQVNGKDSNTGTSPSLAWKTISKVNSAALNPGDNVLFKAGQIWREQLNIQKSGTSTSPVIAGSFGDGSKPVISGSNLLTGFAQYSGSIWRLSLASKPQQVFFNNIRGKLKTSVSSVTSARDWYYDASGKYIYIYSSSNPSSAYTTPGIEASVRSYGVYVNAKYVTVKDIKIEKTSREGLIMSANTEGVVADNIEFIQWTNLESCVNGAVTMTGKNNIVQNCTMGRSTGDDLADQNWAGFMGVAINGSGMQVLNNKIYHNSTENENTNGAYAFGINIISAGGKTNIGGNYIYHVASSAIYMGVNTKSGDEIRIYENIIEYPGQAGISAYKTRASDGIGGKGYVYKNNVSFANRLAGEVGSNGNEASGIHFNDGVKSGTSAANPYIKWYCYENISHHHGGPKMPNVPDACGISMDYNANNVEVYRNLLYSNYGKGLEMWNASNCVVAYNIIYGNDAGITNSAASGGVENAMNNKIYNNTLYKNYNGPAYGPNLNTEIWFGLNAKNLTIKNNILYGSPDGSVYLFLPTNSTGHIVDNNLVYTTRSFIAKDGSYGDQTLAKWQANRGWDKNSIQADPQFTNADAGDFSLKSTSPAINKGVSVSLTTDFFGNALSGTPDLGAVEYTVRDITAPEVESVQLLNETTVKVVFSETINTDDLKTPDNYAVNGVTVASAVPDANSTSVTLSTSTHNTGTYTLHAARIKDLAGNVIKTVNCSGTYTYCSPAVLSSPANNTASLPLEVTLKWKKDVGATGYKLQAAKDAAFTSLVVNDTLLTDTVKSLSSLQASVKYYWRVKTRFNLNEGNWSEVYNFTTSAPVVTPAPADAGTRTVITLNANGGILSGDARLGSMTGMKNARAVYFQGSNGGVTINFEVPKTGKWYAWARMYYMSSGAKKSFFLTSKGTKYILGDDDTKYNQWHWDGYKGAKIDLGTLNAGANSVIISGREPGLTLWVDQIVFTDDSNFVPTDKNLYNLVLVNANGGTLSGDARLGSMTGMKNARAVYFQGSNGGVTINFEVPKTGKWYAWARMYYMSSGAKKSFFLTSKGTKYILGDDDTKYNQWHWDGYKGAKIDLGTLNAGANSVIISGREPGLTLWVDQIVFTDDSTYNPNVSMQKDGEEVETSAVSAAPQIYEISQNYPNPFNPVTNIRYSVPVQSNVMIKVYDILGSEITTLVDEVKSPGTYNVQFNAAGLASGVYIYQIRADNFVETRKMNLLK
jgi:parallel beta-helix repeat protein